eukprot:Polyplicarium_translucidae@DN3232_c0_g1_i3.p1
MMFTQDTNNVRNRHAPPSRFHTAQSASEGPLDAATVKGSRRTPSMDAPPPSGRSVFPPPMTATTTVGVEPSMPDSMLNSAIAYQPRHAPRAPSLTMPGMSVLGGLDRESMGGTPAAPWGKGQFHPLRAGHSAQPSAASSAGGPGAAFAPRAVAPLAPLEGEAEAFASAEEFDNMVGDLRRCFIGWLKKTEGELRRERDSLRRGKAELMEERDRALAELQRERRVEWDKIQEERRRNDAEAAEAAKQITTEREESRRKVNEERNKFDREREVVRRQLLTDREKFRQEYDAFEAERWRVVDSNIATETTVEFNVGGTVFSTARATLCQQPGSYIESLVSGRHQLSRDSSGRIFLDRDPELFRSILNFLRDTTVAPQPRDSTESDALCKEAKAYGVRFFPFPLIFSCGGHDGREHLRAVEVLDPAQQCWRPCRPMETERTYFAGGVLHSRLYAFGGQNMEYKALCDCESYDCLRDCWMRSASLNIPRRNNAGTVLGERALTLGGFDGSSILASVEAYDPRMKNWMQLAPMTTPRSSCTCAAQGDRVIVMGGTKGTRLNTVEWYESRMNKWEVANVEMLEVRSAGCSALLFNHIYAIGGTDAAHNVHASMESLDPDTVSWFFQASMATPRMDASAAVLTDSIIVGGGQHTEVLSSTEFYRPELDEWRPGPAMLFPRYGHQFLLANV